MLGLAILPFAASSAKASDVTFLPDLFGEGMDASDMSPDGNTVVGTLNLPISFNRGRAYRWNRGEGTVMLSEVRANALAVSADGSVVVGGIGSGLFEPYRWTRETGIELLGSIGGTYGIATDVTDDGATIVGHGNNHSGLHGLFRWRSGQIQELTVNMQSVDDAKISGDGSVIGVTFDNLTTGTKRPFRYTDAGGFQALETFGRGGSISGISQNGSVLLGSSYGFGSPARPAFWTADGRIHELATEFNNGSAWRSNADGSMIFGLTQIGQPYRPVRWLNGGNYEYADSIYEQYMPEGWEIAYIRDVSPDGRFVVGSGRNSGHGAVFVIDTVPEPNMAVTLAVLSMGLLMRRRNSVHR
jgi:uncharacterized membrane protein